MNDETEPRDHQAGQHEGAGKRPMALSSEIEGLIAAAREAFSSEVAYQRARALLASKIAGRIAGLAALAAALVFFLLLALVVGLLLALAPLLGTWQALGVVVLALLLGMALAAWAVLRAWRKLKNILTGKGKA
jgi:hypothetical protein